MKKIFAVTLLVIVFSCTATLAQEQAQPLRSFNKIVASPKVNIVLRKGDKETISFVYARIDPKVVNVKVTGHTLKIYLDHARVVEKQETTCHNGDCHKKSIYGDGSITAYITYRELKGIEVRGEQEVSCMDELAADKLKIKAYGETEIDLWKVNADKFKVSFYGENTMTVRSGEVGRQVYRSFGENRIDSRGLKSVRTSTRLYGEGRFKLNASDEVTINGFGESEIVVLGSAHISKGIIIGNATIIPR